MFRCLLIVVIVQFNSAITLSETKTKFSEHSFILRNTPYNNIICPSSKPFNSTNNNKWKILLSSLFVHAKTGIPSLFKKHQLLLINHLIYFRTDKFDKSYLFPIFWETGRTGHWPKYCSFPYFGPLFFDDKTLLVLNFRLISVDFLIEIFTIIRLEFTSEMWASLKQ